MTKVVATVFALYAAYALSAVYAQPSVTGAAFATLTLLAAVGMWMRKPWSQYFVYVVSALVAGQWLWQTGTFVYRNGWPYETTTLNIFGLAPGLCIVAFAVGSSVLAFRSFRVRS
jgi:hypothetical protein